MTKDGSLKRASVFFMNYTPHFLAADVTEIAARYSIRICLEMNIKSIERLGCEDALLNHRWVLNLCK